MTATTTEARTYSIGVNSTGTIHMGRNGADCNNRIGARTITLRQRREVTAEQIADMAARGERLCKRCFSYHLAAIKAAEAVAAEPELAAAKAELEAEPVAAKAEYAVGDAVITKDRGGRIIAGKITWCALYGQMADVAPFVGGDTVSIERHRLNHYPRPQMGATFGIGADSYPMTIVSVSDTATVVTVKPCKVEVVAGETFFITDDAAKPRKFSLRQGGTYREVGTEHGYLSIGKRHFHLDPSF